MSNRYGSNEDFVLAGGGNTSFKENGTLYVKGSGVSLSEIKFGQFVMLDLEKLLKIVDSGYLTDKTQDEKEKQALLDIMKARLPGEENKHPSVETVLHALFPFSYVLHVHPPLINGLSCSNHGKKACDKLFGDKVVWIELEKPGFTLAQKCNKAFKEYKKEKGNHPQVVILQNHGVFISANTVFEIDGLMDYIVGIIKENINEFPSFASVNYDKKLVSSITGKLKEIYSKDTAKNSAVVEFCTNEKVREFVSSKKSFIPVSKSFTPDHIVNCKDEPLFIVSPGELEPEFDNYTKKKGFKPKIVAIQGLGFFALGEDETNAKRAKASYLDLIKIATFASSFGGDNPPPGEFTEFILSWENESYSSKA